MPTVNNKTTIHSVSNVTQVSPQDKKKGSSLSAIIRSVRNGVQRTKHHDQKTQTSAQKDVQLDKFPSVQIVKKSECNKQINDLTKMRDRVSNQNDKLAAELRHMDPKNGRYIDNNAITVELGKFLHESVNSNNLNNHGPLYKMVMTEESQIITSALTSEEQEVSGNQTLSHNEKLVLQKKIAETKLAVADFCLRILRLNEQAEWTPPGDAALNTQSAINADDLLSASMENALSKPYIDSQRGIDRESGLYHEKQFSKSGTCVTHANNHYLAAWCKREGRPFLALTPRRMELLLSAIQNRQNTEIKELASMYIQEGKSSSEANELAMSLLKKNEKNILNNKDSLIMYDVSYAQGGDLPEKKYKVTTGTLLKKEATELINQSYGLPAQITLTSKDAILWHHQLDNVYQLENTQDSLLCTFRANGSKSGHAICFNKSAAGVWYLQDSNFPRPIRCSPGDLIKHLCGTDDRYSVLRNVEHYLNYGDFYKLDSSASISLSHFEPH